HELEVPQALAGAQVEREQRIAEESLAFAIGAVEIVGRRAEREVADAALFVDRDFAPRVHAADVRPRILGPSVVAELAGVRDGVELPYQFAGETVVRAQIARSGAVAFAGRRTHDDRVFEHASRCAALDVACAWNAFAEIDAAVLAERVDGHPVRK